jgi:N-acetylmuramoyl-L-alanine amidase
MRGRIGTEGDWFSMSERSPGLYFRRVEVDEAVSSNVSQSLQFELRPAGSGGSPDSIRMTSKLEVRRRAPGEVFRGVVESGLATFLKKPEGWERWGNWIAQTPFIAHERYGDRFKVDFGQGRDGFVEVENVRADLTSSPGLLPDLGKPEIRFYGDPQIDRVSIDWNTTFPVAHVFETIAGPVSDELRVELTGAVSSHSLGFLPSEEVQGGIQRVEVHESRQGRPPEVRIRLAAGELWGYGFSMVDATTLRLTVRSRPRLEGRILDRPLEGIAIVVDAGHGGSDLGALGPSGLTEADVNLVLSALLGDLLESLGARVEQLRFEDRFVDLDDRVSRALAIDPDLFISVHHNSVGFSTHPMKDRGPKVFYHYPHAIPVATRVAQRLTALLEPGEKPEVLRNVFRVNRNISPCPSILIEGGFVCNPLDEIRLRDQRTLEKMAEAIARGIVDSVTGR